MRTIVQSAIIRLRADAAASMISHNINEYIKLYRSREDIPKTKAALNSAHEAMTRIVERMYRAVIIHVMYIRALEVFLTA